MLGYSIRGTRRWTGRIDQQPSLSIPIPPAPPWVSGRFYGSLLATGTLTTITPATQAQLLMFLVPNWVTVTAVGVEVTVAATAGTRAAFACYTIDRDGLPDNLVWNAGTVTVDATGFRSITISQVMRPGLHWVVYAQETAATSATVRSVGPQAKDLGVMTNSSLRLPGNEGVNGLSMAGAYGNLMIVNGFPRRMGLRAEGTDSYILNSGNLANILLGV